MRTFGLGIETMLARLNQYLRAPLQRLRGLAGNKRGTVAVQFAILVLPLTVLSFGVFDISRASIAKQQLQDALDAAGLMAARSTATTTQGLNAIGGPALAANLASMGDAVLVSSEFVPSGNFINATATARVTPIIANLWLNGDITVTATSQIVRTTNRVELALVLDNTGSMSSNLGTGGSKIAALRTASQNLVNVLAAASARSGDANSVKISVVPFSMTVNVGSSYRNASWIVGAQPTAYGADVISLNSGTPVNRFTMFDRMGIAWAGCVESRPAPYDVQDTPPSAGTPATMFVPYFAPDEPDDNTISYTRWGNTYYFDYDNNYIYDDRTSTTGNDLNAARTRTTNRTKYASSNMDDLDDDADGTGNFGPNRECGMQPIMRLTNDFNAVNTRLNSMVAVGNTNVPMGLMWGWHTLSPNAPFGDGSSYSTQHLSKVVVLLTDGDNTNDETSDPLDSIYTGIGYIWQRRLLASNGVTLDAGSSGEERRNALDSREALLCANMKAQGIIIYAIGVGVSNHSRSILQACASGADHYYDVTDSAQLTAVFNTIAGEIQNLRISQ